MNSSKNVELTKFTRIYSHEHCFTIAYKECLDKLETKYNLPDLDYAVFFEVGNEKVQVKKSQDFELGKKYFICTVGDSKEGSFEYEYDTKSPKESDFGALSLFSF